MVLFHSTNNPTQVLELLRMREDTVLYATKLPQCDYGCFVVGFEADIDKLDDSYDQGGYSVHTQNFCIPLNAIKTDSVKIRRIA